MICVRVRVRVRVCVCACVRVNVLPRLRRRPIHTYVENQIGGGAEEGGLTGTEGRLLQSHRAGSKRGGGGEGRSRRSSDEDQEGNLHLLPRAGSNVSNLGTVREVGRDRRGGALRGP